MSFASTPKDARRAFISAYPMELRNGGLGVDVPCSPSTGTTPIALVGEGDAVECTNWGAYSAFLFFSFSPSGEATQACVCVQPGVSKLYSLPVSETQPPQTTVYAYGYSPLGPTNIQITRGNGN